MKRLLVFLFVFAFGFSAKAQTGTVNAIIGDESFHAVFGAEPNAATDETLRLQTHLAYVEALLRGRDVSNLNENSRRNRAHVLDLLRQYWQAAAFPKNEAYEGRRPCFIDRYGNVCAVGYLVEQTVGRDAAEAINNQHQYDYLLDMNGPELAEWAAVQGLTLEECAMIQPTYGFFPPDRTVEVPVGTGYGVASGALMGVNAGVTVMGFSPRFAGNRTAACIGLVGGTAQVVLGLAHLRRNTTESGVNGPVVTRSYKAQNNLSYLNMAAGTATVVTSAFNLWAANRLRHKRTAVGLYGYPTAPGQMTAGFSLTRTL